MAKLNILTFPDPRLRKVAVPVTKFDKSLENFVSDMLETMYEDCLLYTSDAADE